MEDREIESMLRRFYPSASVLRHHRRGLTREEEERVAVKLLQLRRQYGEDEGLIREKLDEWCQKRGL